jgi:hypothetical protein
MHALSRPTLARSAAALFALLFAAALLAGGPLSQQLFAHLNDHGHAHLHPHGHPFVDARTWLGIPNALDVLSNLPFVVLGVWLLRRAAGSNAVRVLGIGLLLTGFGSALYHWVPTAHTLVADRLGMAVAFAGALALATQGWLGAQAGRGALLLLLPTALLAAVLPAQGNLLPWVLVQFGGVLWLLLAAWAPRLEGSLPVRWGLVVAGYALAKVLEMHDTETFQWTGGWVSGHSLKHLAAAAAVLPVVAALRR